MSGSFPRSIFTPGRGIRATLALSLLGTLFFFGCSDEPFPTQAPALEAPEGVAMAEAGTSTGMRMVRRESVLATGDRSQLRLVDDTGASVDPAEVSWSSGLDAVATVSSKGIVQGIAPGTTIVTARRGSAVAQHHVVVVGGGSSALRVAPWSSVLRPGEEDQLEITDGSGRPVPASEVSWTTSASSVATISSSGRVKAGSPGTAVITVRRGNGVAQHGVIVPGDSDSQNPDPEPEPEPEPEPDPDPNPGPDSGNLEISPRESVLGRGDVSLLRPTDADGDPVDPATVTWASAMSSVATVSSSGLVRGIEPGMIVVTGRKGDAVAHSIATVVGGGSESLRIPAFQSRLSPGERTEIQVTNASGVPVRASDLQWSTSASSVATISSSGVVTAVAGGFAIITARRSGGVAQHAVYVDGESGASPEEGRQIRIVRGDGQSATVGTPLPTRPTVRVVDGSGNGISGVTVRWSVRSGGGSVSSASTTTGSSGETSVAWTLGSTAGGQSLEAGATDAGSVRFSATATSGSSGGGIRITRKESVLAPGDVSLLQVVDDAGEPVDVSELTFSSSAPGIATVSSRGLVTGVSRGTATIVARRGSASAEHSAVVVGGSDPTGEVSRIEVTPSSSTLDEGQSVQLQATARDASGNVVDADFTWASDSPGVAQVSSGGRVTGVSAGSTTIRVGAGNVTATHQVTVQGSGPAPTPPRGEWNEPDNFVTAVDEHWNSFDDLGWYHHGSMPGSVDIRNGKVVWTYPAGMEGGRVPGSPVVLEYRHGPYEYHRDEGVTLSANFHGHRSGVNKMRYWSGVRPRSPVGFFGADNAPLTLGINTTDWPMGVHKLRWDSPENYASPSEADAEVTRGVPHDIETLLYIGTPGNADGWVKVWLNGVLVLDFRNMAILWADEPARITQIHLAPVWGGMGDIVPETQTFSIDRTYVSIRP